MATLLPTETPTVEVKREEINLDTTKGKARIAYYKEKCGISKYFEMCELVKFLKTLEKSPLRCGDYRIYIGLYNLSFIIKDRVIYGSAFMPNLLNKELIKELQKDDYPCGVLLTDVQSNSEKNKGFRAFVLINADRGVDIGPEVSLLSTLNSFNMPLVSFQCLAQFWNDTASEAKLIKMLSNGDLRLLDYTGDEVIPFSAEEKKILKDKGYDELKPPLGFTFLSPPAWHRSGTCLFHETKNNEYYLLGQDEGTYFGVQLPSSANTVKEAFEVLTPDIVKGKAGIKRQGEWFFLPVNKKEVPKSKDCAIQFCTNDEDGVETVHLPLDNAKSNHHFIVTSDGRIGKDGQVFALNPELHHEEHHDVGAVGWHAFVRNTAIRSMSQEGVD